MLGMQLQNHPGFMEAMSTSAECAQAQRKAELLAVCTCSQRLMTSLLAALHKNPLHLGTLPALKCLSYCLRYAITTVNSPNQQECSSSPTLQKELILTPLA